jgi:hypothetical protein
MLQPRNDRRRLRAVLSTCERRNGTSHAHDTHVPVGSYRGPFKLAAIGLGPADCAAQRPAYDTIGQADPLGEPARARAQRRVAAAPAVAVQRRPARTGRRGPKLSQHTRDITAEVYDQSRNGELLAAGVLFAC